MAHEIRISPCNVDGMDALLPSLRNYFPHFPTTGAAAGIFHFVNGGMRSPEFKKNDVLKEVIRAFLANNNYPRDFTGKIILGFYNGEFVNCQCYLPPARDVDGELGKGLRNLHIQNMLLEGYIDRHISSGGKIALK